MLKDVSVSAMMNLIHESRSIFKDWGKQPPSKASYCAADNFAGVVRCSLLSIPIPVPVPVPIPIPIPIPIPTSTVFLTITTLRLLAGAEGNQHCNKKRPGH